MKDVKNKKMHYAWAILVGCILLKIGLGGVVMCIAGNFVTPVVRELGSSVSEFTMLVSVKAAVMALMYTTAAKILASRKIGYVMGIAALAQILGIALMATYNSVYMFYFSGALIGIGVAFTGYVAVPILINMWFKEKTGTVLGIVMAVEKVAVVMYTILSGQFIVKFGWRNTYVILALISLIVSVPALFLLVKTPEEKGIEPYGAKIIADNLEENNLKEPDFTCKEALRMPLFYLVWLTCMLYSVACGVQQYIANFSTMEMQQTITFGSTAAMSVSLGCAISSTMLGYINDKFGVKAGLAWGAFFYAVGYGLLIMSINNPELIIAASILVGFGGVMYTVQSPLLVRFVLGDKNYSSIWALMMVGNSLIGGFSFSPIGLFYDINGSYKGAFIMAIALHVIAFLTGSKSVNMSIKTSRIGKIK